MMRRKDALMGFCELSVMGSVGKNYWRWVRYARIISVPWVDRPFKVRKLPGAGGLVGGDVHSSCRLCGQWQCQCGRLFFSA